MSGLAAVWNAPPSSEYSTLATPHETPPAVGSVASVKFGGVNATSYVVNSATQITAIVPAGAGAATVDVTVTALGAVSSN